MVLALSFTLTESQNNRANYDLAHPFNRFTRFGYLDISSIRSEILISSGSFDMFGQVILVN